MQKTALTVEMVKIVSEMCDLTAQLYSEEGLVSKVT